MTSEEYRSIIRRIAINCIKKGFPGLKKKELEETARRIARNVHARMYGANVDGVDSPIWGIQGDNILREHNKPKIDAKELLNDEESIDI